MSRVLTGLSLSLVLWSGSSFGSLLHSHSRAASVSLRSSSNGDYFTVKVNQFFKDPVPKLIQDAVALKDDAKSPSQDFDIIELITARPGKPGVPRPLWFVCLASIPSGLLWYGYYKFAVEEELLTMELESGKEPRGFGGYGTLGPFTYGILFGPIAAILHLPGGIQWTTLAIVYIYYTQFLLYDRVNELYKERGQEPPLTVWWCLPIFFPFNLIVGLRQVHFLSQYWYMKRGVTEPPNDPVADFFPFITADNFTWQEFLTTPSLWCVLLRSQKSIDQSTLPEPIQELLNLGKSSSRTKFRK
jgi:hypothetical protein